MRSKGLVIFIAKCRAIHNGTQADVLKNICTGLRVSQTASVRGGKAWQAHTLGLDKNYTGLLLEIVNLSSPPQTSESGYKVEPRLRELALSG